MGDMNELCSAHRLAIDSRMGILHCQRIKQAGFSNENFSGKLVIGILHTWSEPNPCRIHFRERATEVMRGVGQVNGFPVVSPVCSLGEPFIKPTTTLYHNLLAI